MRRKERTQLAAARIPAIEAEAIAQLKKGAHRDERTGCLLWYAPRNHRGYGTTTFRRETWFTHRLSYVAHNGPIPIGMFVCHRCDNPACIAIEHLFLGTPQENTDDARRKGRLRWRSSCLDPVRVGEIKQRLHQGEGPSKIAREMGVSLHSVQNVKGGRAWRHVPAAPPPRDSAAGGAEPGAVGGASGCPPPRECAAGGAEQGAAVRSGGGLCAAK